MFWRKFTSEKIRLNESVEWLGKDTHEARHQEKSIKKSAGNLEFLRIAEILLSFNPRR